MRRIAPLLLGIAALGACDAIIGIPNRELDPHLACAGGGCECSPGFASCDGKDDNGCETDISQPSNCGGCGNACSNGTCAAGKCACNAGYQDCDGSLKNGCETFVESDVHHCGVCGHDCKGGDCKAGVCQPAVLAQGVSPLDLALGGDHVYFTTASGLSRVPKIGGAIEGVAPMMVDSGALATTADTAYFSVNKQIQAKSFDAAKPVALFTDNAEPDYGMTLCGTSLCWLETPGQHYLIRAPLDGGQRSTIVVADYGSRLVADATSAYWATTAGAIVSVDHDKSAIKTLISGIMGYDLATDGTNVYWDDDKAINKIPVAGGMSTAVVSTTTADRLAVDGASIYFSDYMTGAINRVPLGGGTTTTVAPATGASVAVMAVDDTNIYWSTGTDILRIAK